MRFIDARKLIVEARLKLNLEGYPGENLKPTIVKSAIEVFNQTPLHVQQTMQVLNNSLEHAKKKGIERQSARQSIASEQTKKSKATAFGTIRFGTSKRIPEPLPPSASRREPFLHHLAQRKLEGAIRILRRRHSAAFGHRGEN